jgi:translation elongation factor P/translation initiation factor 5A
MLSLDNLDDIYNGRFIEIDGEPVQIRPVNIHSTDKVKHFVKTKSSQKEGQRKN